MTEYAQGPASPADHERAAPAVRQRVAISMSSSDSQVDGSRSGDHDPASEQALVAALRRGDERAFDTLVTRHHTAMVRLARVWVRDAPAAEEVVQETWLAVVKGIDAFEGRSPLRSWIFSILANKAKRCGSRESRSRPFSAFATDVEWGGPPAMDPAFFFPAGDEWAGHWIEPLREREGSPEPRMLAEEMGGFILRQIDELPAHFRGVILLRDLHGLTAEETCTMLGISASNQRVLLHRARTKLRIALGPYLNGNDDNGG
ncbi:MAG: RNA polymerase sigma factor RpoE [uncultured Thermomicrobiales bacterium]|uniref:RNA polymerase sigma factor RpoE n=1 Tax=uncultured Thermomicrobiales bacterium TaxID=1645740 RepID=A0A6J4UTJ8_9BACT|nr:MAG: RNA polymerase sigma factor RpoE [uncultured Thermomicrobiales bacterium]